MDHFRNGAAILSWDGHAKSLARAEDSPALFVRGLNLNGPAVVIDKQQWHGKDADNYTCNGNSFDNQAVTLKPPTDSERAKMIRSSRWENEIEVSLTSLPAGPRQIFLYVW